jgi:ATP-dependent helicase/nuclease subunit B
MYTFSRLRDLALVMAKSVLDEFAASDFKVLGQEIRISEHRENAFKPIEIQVTDESDSPKIILSGIIDRVDYFDGEDRRYLRIVDYKTGSHPFDIEGLEDGNDVQLPAYLFTAALAKNKDIIGGEKEIFPASALFLSANESAGKISPERSGFFVDNLDVLRAASNDLDKNILGGIVVDKDTGEIKKGNAVSEEGIKEIDLSLRSVIQSTGKSIFEGRAPRTPSPSACKFCYLRSSCPVAAKSTNH